MTTTDHAAPTAIDRTGRAQRRDVALAGLADITKSLRIVERWLTAHWPAHLAIKVGTFQNNDGMIVLSSVCLTTGELVAATEALTSDDGLVLLTERGALWSVRRRWGHVYVEAWARQADIDIDLVRSVIHAPAPARVVEAGA